MTWAASVGLLVVAPLVGILAPVHAEAPEPDRWWDHTTMDADGDRVDDALAPHLLAPDRLTVIVDYARLPTGSERAAVESAGCAIRFAYENFPMLAATCTPAVVRGLLALPGVVFVEETMRIDRELKDSVPLIGAPQAWQQYGATGKGIVVAVLDDGAFEQHPDLQSKLAGHKDAGAPQSPFASPVTIVAPAGSEGHGTHVAGIIVGPGTQSKGVYKGVAPDAQFVNVKVFSTDGSTTSDLVLNGLDWTISNMGPLKIKIASMSLGGKPSDGLDALSRGVDIAVDKGLVVVAAAGNAGPDPKTVSSPGAAAKAITVGAVDKTKRIGSFSSRGPTLDGRTKPDIAAPGVDIVSTIPPHQATATNFFGQTTDAIFYGALTGTSMATPHVAGVAALMLQANPKLSPMDIKKILLVTAQDLGAPGADNETGFGFVNAIAAVQVAKDPSILDRPEFRSRLATIPDPPAASFLDRLSYEAQSIQRNGEMPFAIGGAVAGLVVVSLVATVAVKRRP